ncbi:MAG: DNA/RNA nuclease SfsA [Candidatus Cloacimonadota bacterium]|nr:DNA/RNA nuclease SfsA [Candidatus Cloacimonadota bacterium]
MEFPEKLITGYFLKRNKRFMVDLQLENGKVVTAHCPNSGSMKTCLKPHWPVRLSISNNPKRKFKYTFEMIHNGKTWIGINTNLTNKIVQHGIINGKIPELNGYSTLKREVRYGKNSRIDILLEKIDKKCFVEIKSVTLVENGNYLFPDAVTKRGQKHLLELISMKRQGHRAIIFFLIQRNDGCIFAPATNIDPDYSKLLKKAYQEGVEILPYQAEVTPQKIGIEKKVEITLQP